MSDRDDDGLIEVAQGTVVTLDERELVVLIAEGVLYIERERGIDIETAYLRLQGPDIGPGVTVGLARAARNVLACIERQLRPLTTKRVQAL